MNPSAAGVLTANDDHPHGTTRDAATQRASQSWQHSTPLGINGNHHGPRSHHQRWETHYAALVRYAADVGHACPPVAYVTGDGVPLGQWVSIQRRRYSCGRMPAERRERLESLPGWLWHAYRGHWEAHYRTLLRYADSVGHACPPLAYVTADGMQLGGWVSRQRKRYSQDQLSDDRAELLEALPGWVWGIDTAVEWETAWQRAFCALQRFAELHGHARPAWKTRFGGFRLGVWVSKQRQRYHAGRLDPAHARRLQELPGWVWKPGSGRPPSRQGSTR